MLRIARLVTTCHAPADRREVYSLVNSIARDQLAGELSARLGPSLARQTGVVRIRRLHVRIVLRGRSFDRRRLIDAWVQAICRQLFTALAAPPGSARFEVERAPSTAHQRAAFVRDLLSGAASGKWYYRDRESILRLPRAEGVMAALREEPGEIAATLEALAGLGTLEAALAILDDLALEELFRAIAKGEILTDPAWPEALAAIARVLARHRPSRGLRLDSRAQALRLFTLARGMHVNLSPRVWLTMLTALALLAENGELWAASPRSVERICGRPLTPDTIALLEALRGSFAEATAPLRPALLSVLDAAGLSVPAPAIAAAEPAPWLEFDGASLLLLTGPLLRLGLAPDWREAAGRARLYALGCALRGAFDPAIPEVDRNAALFAGLFGELQASALRPFFAGPGTDWRAVMDSEAARLIAFWTAQIPGFRRASREAMVRQFLTAPGRVRVEEKRVAVVLAPRPYYVALRIASLDGPVESVPWFDGRRLEFQIEGL